MSANPLLSNASRRGGAELLLLLLLLVVAGASSWADGYSVEHGCPVGGCGAVAGTGVQLRGAVAPATVAGQCSSTSMQLDSRNVAAQTLVDRIVRFALAAGWNLKGAPMDTSATVGEIFTGPAGYPLKVGELYAWSGSAYEAIPDSAPLAGEQGFWVYSYWGGESQPVSRVKSERGSLEESLEVGWNLYSPPHHMNRPESEDHVVSAWRWDPTIWQYVEIPPGDPMLPGQAYWLLYE